MVHQARKEILDQTTGLSNTASKWLWEATSGRAWWQKLPLLLPPQPLIYRSILPMYSEVYCQVGSTEQSQQCGPFMASPHHLWQWNMQAVGVTEEEDCKTKSYKTEINCTIVFLEHFSPGHPCENDSLSRTPPPPNPGGDAVARTWSAITVIPKLLHVCSDIGLIMFKQTYSQERSLNA